jgi:hypothetical protein
MKASRLIELLKELPGDTRILIPKASETSSFLDAERLVQRNGFSTVAFLGASLSPDVKEVKTRAEREYDEARASKRWRTHDGRLLKVENMTRDHLINAAALASDWTNRTKLAMTPKRRAMAQNVRDEIVRRGIFNNTEGCKCTNSTDAQFRRWAKAL